MKLQALSLSTLFLLTAANAQQQRHPQIAKRQATTSTTSSSSTTSAATTGGSSSSPSSAPATTTRATTSSGSASASVATSGVTTTGPPPLATWSGVPPLANITSGMPTKSPLVVTATFPAGAKPSYSGAPPLPKPFVFKPGQWPAQDKVPDTNSPEVTEWMKELQGFDIPNLNPTADGSCVGDPVAASAAASRGWWTCGGYTRVTDITVCPDKLTWGVSFDDGPSPYTQSLLNYLTEKKIMATFFVVGSRVIERPAVLVEEYMTGHEISVHTWSHRPLTSLTNEQIVAELGWTRKAIHEVLGITPTTMRPPFGDIDDRVRAIALAMGMVPIMWTRTPSGGQFDTNDWRVAGGIVNGTSSFSTFQTILNNATTIDTGFIVLQHDLFEITVNLAVGYTLNAALTHNPPLTLQPIGQCSKIPTSNLYRETNTNTTFPHPNITISVDGSANGGSGGSNASAGVANSAPILIMALFAGFMVLVGSL